MIAADRQAWLDERRKGLGGSDAAAAAGLSRYKTPMQLFFEKLGELPDDDLSDNDAVQWGIKLEAVVADEYAARTGAKIARVNRILRHPEHEFMLANIDRRIVGEKRGLECKTAGQWAADSENWGPSGTDQVPIEYICQCQHYLAVTGWESWDLAVLIGGRDFRTYTIPRDESLIEHLVKIESQFWECVQTRTPPEAITVADAVLRNPKHKAGKVVEATSEIVQLFADLRRLKSDADEINTKMERVKAKICDFLGDGEVLAINGQPLMTWKQQSTTRFDQKAFAAAHPELASEFRSETSFRVMRMKGE
jgi:putative phage-type endonuclease